MKVKFVADNFVKVSGSIEDFIKSRFGKLNRRRQGGEAREASGEAEGVGREPETRTTKEKMTMMNLPSIHGNGLMGDFSIMYGGCYFLDAVRLVDDNSKIRNIFQNIRF